MQALQQIEPLHAPCLCIPVRYDRLLLLASFFSLLILFAHLFPQTGDGDAVMHYLNARDSLTQPIKLTGSWARVGDKLPLLIPAQFGLFATHCTAALISILCAWQTIRLAKDLNLPNPNLAALFLIFQPFVFSLAADTMTELPFAFGIVIAIRLWLHQRYFASCMVIGYMPTVRPEGFFLAALWATMIIAHCTRSRRFSSPYLLALIWGTLAWFIFCWILRDDPTYFFRDGWSWPADSLRVYGHGSFFSHINRWPLYCGPILFPLFLLGLRWNKLTSVAVALLILELILPSPIRETLLPWPALALVIAIAWSVRKTRFAAGIWVFLLIFTLHTILWWRGWFASCGLMRILATISPITAIICLMGWNRVGSPWPGLARIAIIPALIATAITYYLIEPVHWRVFPQQRAAQFAASNHLLDHAPMLIFGDPMAQAVLNLPPNPPNILRNDCDRATECRHLLHAPIGTIGFWDNQHAAPWFGVNLADLPALGYTILYQTSSRAPLNIEWMDPSRLPRDQTYVVIRKDHRGKMPITIR